MDLQQCNDARLRSFVPVASDSHFPIQNLPLGVFSNAADTRARPGVAIGDQILDLAQLQSAGLLATVPGHGLLRESTLNSFLSQGRVAWRALRQRVSELLRHDNPQLRDDASLQESALHPQAGATMHLPMHVGAFSDFLLSQEHALNCVDIMGGGARAGQLWPNWYHLPMGYNSRASSVIVGGTPVRRPWGQMSPTDGGAPRWDICRQLDFELETALVVGKPNPLGEPIRMRDVAEHAYGVVLLNDWSARDIQQWEAQPLGVFNSKNFATSISPWIVSLDALEPFRVAGPVQDPPPLPYLRDGDLRNYGTHLEAIVKGADDDRASTVCRTNTQTLYWSYAQQLVHQTSAGCNVQAGDLLGSGTVSGRGAGAQACLFEVTRDGRQTFQLEHGGTRLYLDDGDEVTLTGWCQGDGYRVGFGECVGRVLPALPRD